MVESSVDLKHSMRGWRSYEGQICDERRMMLYVSHFHISGVRMIQEGWV